MPQPTRSILISFLVVLTIALVVTLSPKSLLTSNGGQGMVNTALADDDHHDGDGDHHYGTDGYDKEGRDRDGRDRHGYDREGYSSRGHDREGYDREGYRDDGHHRDGHYDRAHDRHGEQDPSSPTDAQSTSGGPPAPTYTPQRPVVRQY